MDFYDKKMKLLYKKKNIINKKLSPISIISFLFFIIIIINSVTPVICAVQNRDEQVRNELRSLLETKEIKNPDKGPSFIQQVIEKIFEAAGSVFKKIFDYILPKINFSGSANINPGVLVLAEVGGVLILFTALFIIIFIIARRFIRSRKILYELDNKILANITDPEVLDKKIFEFASQGEYTQAIRYMYLNMLIRFNEAGYIKINKSKTNGQYLKELDLYKFNNINEVKEFTRVFNFYWYGKKSASKDIYEFWLERCRALVKEAAV